MSDMDKMSEQAAEELSEVYEQLKSDAKLLVSDLSEGVTLWKSAAYLMVVVAALEFLLFWITLNPADAKIMSTPVEYVATAGAGTAALLGGFVAGRKFVALRRKYSRLFAASKRMR